MLRRLQSQKIIFIILFALLIRSIGILSRPIWYDEAFSILFAEKGPAAMLYGTLTPTGAGSADIHPLGYYVMLWLWMKVFGQSLFAVRFLSVLTGLGVIILVYRLARDLFNEDTALTSSLLVAILPFQVHFGQEIRMYVFLALWLTLATYSLIHRQWILFAVSATLAQYTHNLAAVYLIPLALAPVFQRDWKTLRSLTFAGLASMILYAPWLIQLPAQVGKVKAAYWVTRPGVERLFTLFLFYLPNLPLAGPWLMIGLFLATLIIAFTTFQTYRAVKQRLPGTNHGLWLAYLSFAPPFLLWLISQAVPVYIERALLPSHVMFCIWLAWALTKTPIPRPIQQTLFVLVILVSAMGLYQHVTFSGFPYGPYATLDQSLSRRIKVSDVIIHSSKLSYIPAVYFNRALPQGFITDPTGSEVDTLAPATIEILKSTFFEDIESASAGASRVWFIIYQKSIDEFTQRGEETHPHLKYLNENFDLVSVEEWSDLRLYLFTRRAP